MTVTKKDLVDHLVDTTGLKARESRQVVESFFNTIRETLACSLLRRPAKRCSYPALVVLTFWISGRDRVQSKKRPAF